MNDWYVLTYIQSGLLQPCPFDPNPIKSSFAFLLNLLFFLRQIKDAQIHYE